MNASDLPLIDGGKDRQTTPDRIAAILREEILSGRLADGVELSQVALADHFGVSRVPIREALRQLQAEGLVQQPAYLRAVVAGLSRARVMELFDVRVRLETYLLERSAPQLDHAALNKITDIERRLEATIDHDQWLLLNRELHRELFFAADAPFTLDLVATITARTTRYLSTASGGQGVRRKSEAEQEHRDIIQALREGDVQQAVAVLAQHVEGTRSRVAELLDVMNQAHAITDSTIQSTQQEEPDGGN